MEGIISFLINPWEIYRDTVAKLSVMYFEEELTAVTGDSERQEGRLNNLNNHFSK